MRGFVREWHAADIAAAFGEGVALAVVAYAEGHPGCTFLAALHAVGAL